MMTEKDAGRKDAGSRNNLERQTIRCTDQKILLVFFVLFFYVWCMVGTVGIFWHLLLLPENNVAAKRLAERGGDAKTFFVCG